MFRIFALLSILLFPVSTIAGTTVIIRSGNSVYAYSSGGSIAVTVRSGTVYSTHRSYGSTIHRGPSTNYNGVNTNYGPSTNYGGVNSNHGPATNYGGINRNHGPTTNYGGVNINYDRRTTNHGGTNINRYRR